MPTVAALVSQVALGARLAAKGIYIRKTRADIALFSTSSRAIGNHFPAEFAGWTRRQHG